MKQVFFLSRGHVNKLHGACLIFISFFLYSSFTHAQNTQLIIKPGTTVKQSGGSLVLNNTDVTADGFLDASSGTIIFSGGAASSIGGTTIPLIQVLTLNKPGTQLTLNNGVKVLSSAGFTAGLIELNNQTLELGPPAVLQSESETSRITGVSGGAVTAAQASVSNPSSLNIGNLGAVITTSSNLGNVNISRMHKPAVNVSNASLTGIQRTYLIQPANNTALNATLRFYYFEAELDGKVELTLSLWKSTDGVAWTNEGASSRNATANYVELTGIADYSYWTLTDALNPLPVNLTFFKAICENGYALIQWKTATEINSDYFEIERSIDAVNWVSLQSVQASNNSTGSSYSYKDDSPQATAFYRLKIVDKSGSLTYSPVFNGGCSDVAMPLTVNPNPSHNQAVAKLSVREETKATIQLINMKGQVLYTSQWNLQAGTNQFSLPVAQLPAGSYVIKVLLSKTVLQSTFIKQ